jgi:integrase
MKLTAANIRALKLPPGVDDRVFFDERLPGFGLRVRASGVHSWMVQYGKPAKRVVLGLLSGLDPGAAFASAKDLLAQVRLGRDPAAERAQARARAAETFGALLPRYLDRQRAKLKPRSYVETERYLKDRAKPLHRAPIESIERRTIASLLAEIERDGATTAIRARAALSAYFGWAAREGYISQNPVSFTNKAVEPGARDRTPGDDELGMILRALRDDDYGAIVRLLALTGARRDEIGALTWDEIDFGAATVTLTGERTKSGQPHVIPLPPLALEILKARAPGDEGSRGYVFGRGAGPFSGWSKAKAKLDFRIAEMRDGRALPPWTLHDLRRALSSWLHDHGVAPHIVESILGHVSGHKGGVAGVYNKALYLDERRRALARWGEHIASLVAEPIDAKIVNLR